MAKPFKLPKKINGFKLPKAARKQINRVLAKVQGEELEALVGVIMTALVAHLVEKGKGGKLATRVRDAVGSHLAH